MRLDRHRTLLRLFAFVPVFKRHPEKRAVGVLHAAEQAEANHRRDNLHARRVLQDLFDLLAAVIGALQRSGKGKLHVDEDIALVFLRQEADGKLLAKQAGQRPQRPARQHAERRSCESTRGRRRHSHPSPAKHAVEPVEEFAERASCLLLGPQQQRRKRRAKRQRVKSGDEDRNGDGHGELLIEPAGDPGNEHRRQNTAARMMAMPTTGPETSSIALKAASFGDSPSSM